MTNPSHSGEKMYQKGELVVYGGIGVCRIADLVTPDFLGAGTNRLYYVLEPVYRTGTIYAPTDTAAHMRRVITAEEANALIDSMPHVAALDLHGQAPR